MRPGNPLNSDHAGSKSSKLRTAVPLIALAICGVGAFLWPASFWPGYLAAAGFWTSVGLGCLGLRLLHLLTGGRWGTAMARELHAGLGAIAATVLFVLPLFSAARWLYPWATTLSGLNEHQQAYLAPRWVLIRIALVWAVWLLLAIWLVRGYLRAARVSTFVLSARKAAAAMILFWLTVTSAAVDGLMSLDPTWTSSMFGAIQVVGCAVAGLAWVLIVRSGKEVLSENDREISHDLGNLLLAFNLVWVYLSFSQYLIIWAGDLPHEVAWYAARGTGNAGRVGTGLLILHFVVPFVLLLSVDLKRQPRLLAAVAGLLLVTRVADFGWTVFPSIPGADWRSSFWMAASVVLLGSLWIRLFEMIHTRLPFSAPPLVTGTESHAPTEAAEVPT